MVDKSAEMWVEKKGQPVVALMAARKVEWTVDRWVSASVEHWVSSWVNMSEHCWVDLWVD